MSRPVRPRVYTAIAAVTAELSRIGIGKGRFNEDSSFAFRGIDDIYNTLSPILSRHRLCLLPHVIDRVRLEHRTTNGDVIFSVSVRAAFDLVSSIDASSHRIETYGEAMDKGDKATAKALSAAYKYAVMQTFCIPIAGSDDPDSVTPPAIAIRSQVPDQGWETWTADIQSVVTGCSTHEALDRLQNTYRARLRALSVADPTLYATLGDAIRAQRATFPSRTERKAA